MSADDSPGTRLAAEIDPLCDRFEKEWRQGGSPKLEDFLAQGPSAQQSLLLREFLHIELRWRCQRGQAPAVQEYIARFPGDRSLILDVFSHVFPAVTLGGGASGLFEDGTRSSLILRAKSRDAEAWKRLVDLYGPLVVYWCGRSSLSSEDAADIVQEVFRAVSHNLANFELDARRGSFRGWLLTITQNKIRDFYRRRANHPPAVGGSANDDFLDQIPAVVDSSDQQSNRERSQLIRRVLEAIRSEFEQRTWQAFWQTAVESRSAADVGRDLGMTALAVRKAKSRVLHRLRAELENLAE